ncbi:MAG TPA: hypothetical protein VHB97_04895, partial [Polyangia bacterium]|nr:hypothetical protein [Polyangia bacterium]
MRAAILHSAEAFGALAERWDALASATDAGLFLSHRWLLAWWRAFHGVDELWVFTVEDDAVEGAPLIAAWPLCLRAPRSGALRVGELRVVGDLGGAATSDRSILCREGRELEACALLVEALLGARGWDVLDVPTSRREIGEAMQRAIVGAGAKLDRSEQS